MPPQTLHLEVAEYTNAYQWRWKLHEPGGLPFLADHTVELNREDPHYRALLDLPGYVHHYAASDRREVEEWRLVEEAGVWIGERVLGTSIADALLARARPAVAVRVRVPPTADWLLSLPLEIARRAANEDTLTRRGVCFVFETAGEEPLDADPVGKRLRILALFSLPPAGSPLNLRRERQMLRQRVQELVGDRGLAVDLHVLQYGVTRDRLQNVLQQGEGWDVIHFSGHGLPGALVLEQPDGRTDQVTATDLAQLIQQAGGRLKLVTLSACLSAAATIDQTLDWLGITPDTVARRDSPGGPVLPEMVKAVPTVARALTEALGCAVLGMRYAVEDEFAIRLVDGIYDLLLDKGQPLPQAVRLTLNRIAGDKGATRPGALSISAPALFGPKAADIVLTPPQGDGRETNMKLAYVRDRRPEPDYFVGRVAALTRASAALAIRSGESGVLFYGMAGAGKTFCAAELVYHHAAAGRFRFFIWYSAPEQGKDIALAVRDFALALERQLPELAMVHVIDREDAFRDWLPRLKEMLAKNGVLIALDNLESLLTETGRWRDPRWGLLIEALLTPGGLSRTLLTSRIRPTDLPGSAAVIAVHALPRDEALLLVRELPNLRRLLDGAAPEVTQEQGRQLVRRLLRLVQGHPKLIELAEGLAKDPTQLEAQLDQADTAQDKGADELEAFFQAGETRLDEAAFLSGLRRWTRGVASTLPEPARLFFHFLCALEEGDREGRIIQGTWRHVWQQFGRPDPAPALATVLEPLVAAALVDRQTADPGAQDFVLVLHPGVADAGRAEAGAALQAAVDQRLAAMWDGVMQQGLEAQGKEPTGALIARAGIAAYPYLSRLGDWGAAGWMLERVLHFDKAPRTIAAVLPLAQRIAAVTAGTEEETINQGRLANVYNDADRPAEAEPLMRTVIEHSVARGDFATASVSALDLARLLRDTGRLREALQVVEGYADYSRRAGHGPWTRLTGELLGLQLLLLLGQHAIVMNRVAELRAKMQKLPDPPDENDGLVKIWNVREETLGVGRAAALRLGEWQAALDLNAEIHESEKRRGASLLEQALTRVNDYGPLLSLARRPMPPSERLQRYAEARKLLDECRDVFEQENELQGLELVFSALASLEGDLGHAGEARRFAKTSLRFAYTVGIPEQIANRHFNLASVFTRCGGNWCAVFGHRLAAILIWSATGSGRLRENITVLVHGLRHVGASAASALPADFAALCATVQKVDGVRFHDLMQTLLPDEDRMNAALQETIATAMAASRQQEEPGDEGDGR